MALVQISIIVQDADGDRSSINIPLSLGEHTLANLAQFAQDMTELIDAVTGGQVVSLGFFVSVDLPEGIKDTPVALSEVQIGGLLSFDVDDSEYRHSIRIPSMTPTLFVGDSVNASDTDVAALITALSEGLTVNAVLIEPTNKYELTLGSYIEGVKSFRRN